MSVKVNGAADKTVTVRRTVFKQTTEDMETIEVRPFVTDTARVRASRGVTLNLGNYESARIEVSIDLPCYKEEILPCYRDLVEEVETLMRGEIQKVLNQTNPSDEDRAIDLNSL